MENKRGAFQDIDIYRFVCRIRDPVFFYAELSVGLHLIPFVLVKPKSDMTPAEKAKAKNTIQILHLNDEDQASQRCEIVMAYIHGDISLQFLEAKYPFITSELQRQHLYEKIKDMIKLLP